MNTTDFNEKLIEDYGLYYSKADVLEALESFKNKPMLLFDMVAESGLAVMADIREYVAEWMMTQQAKTRARL